MLALSDTPKILPRYNNYNNTEAYYEKVCQIDRNASRTCYPDGCCGLLR